MLVLGAVFGVELSLNGKELHEDFYLHCVGSNKISISKIMTEFSFLDASNRLNYK